LFCKAPRRVRVLVKVICSLLAVLLRSDSTIGLSIAKFYGMVNLVRLTYYARGWPSFG